MILLVSASPVAEHVAGLLQQRLGITVQHAESMKRARSLARLQSYKAMILDESSVDAELAAEPLGTEAILVTANLAIHDGERVAREVKLALQRAERERAAASQFAARQLRGQLKQYLTEALVCVELAANVAELPPASEDKINQALAALKRLRERLEG